MHQSTGPGPINMVCRYLVKDGQQSRFQELLAEHWKTLHSAGLTTETPARVRQFTDQKGRCAFVEEFAWRGPESPSTAHETPSVLALWEPMGSFCSDMEFWAEVPTA